MPAPTRTERRGGRPENPQRERRSTPTAYQLRVTLLGIRPPVWRRILVPPEASVDYLHRAIQVAMGWTDSHLHHFLLGQRPNLISVEPPDPENEGIYPTVDSTHLTIRELFRRGGGRALYEYDFGDGWVHDVRLEKDIPVPAGMSLPHCVEGKRACPPEDCGGVYGYVDIVRMVRDPKFKPEGQSREEMLEWLGAEFDPEAFEIEEVNSQFAPPRRAGSRVRHRRGTTGSRVG